MAVPTRNADLFHRPLLLFVLSFLLLSSLVSSIEWLDIDPSDLKALQILETELGVNGQRSSSSEVNPCGQRGVSCERRRSATTGEFSLLRVTRLVYRSRSLTGSISPVIGMLSELKELTLSNNQLVNGVPVNILNCKQLEVLDLRKNRFSGQIPGNFSSLSRLRVLDLSSNKFSGNLNFLKNLRNLEKLSVADNHFSGKIREPVESFQNLRFFDFSGNRFLEGPVPVMSKTKLQTSPHQTRHILAETPSSNSTKKSHNTTSKATGEAQKQKKKKKKKKNKRKKVAAWILGFVVGGIGGTISGFVFSVMFKLIITAIKGSRKPTGPSIFSPLIKRAEDLAFLEDETAVASLEIIGRGGCGEVFKAELPNSNGKIIAVKKVIQPPKDANELADEDTKFLNRKMRQIRSEIATVGQIRHRNLLPLLAHVSRPECHYLVYEFMKNGSLQDILTEVSNGTKELMWPARHKIAIGIAAGLEYLHIDHRPRIIHRDLKPANVLLDDDMEARIADFGLAKSMPDAATHLTISSVAGTVGYIAPEYHQTLKFTDKCDIYSFGVILGVLVIGKLPSDEFFQHTDEVSLIKWMRNVITSENPSLAIDPKLLEQGFDEQILLVLKIACFCTLDDPKQRPSSKDIRTMLSQIKH